MSFDLRQYRDKHKDRYGNADLETVAKDLYYSQGMDQKGYKTPEQFYQDYGLDKQIVKHREQQAQAPSNVGERGVLGDLGSSLARGGARAVSLAGHALQTLDPDGGMDFFEGVGERMARSAEHAQENWDIMQRDKSERTGEDSFVWKGVKSGFESAVPSLSGGLGGAAAGGALGSIVPGVGTTIGSIVGGIAGTVGMFGFGTYGQSKKEAVDKGLSEDEAHSYAVKQGLIEGGGETVANLISMATFGLFKPLTQAAKQPIKQTLKQVLKTPKDQLLKNFLVNTATNEVPAEMIQEGLQAKVDQEYGMGNVPWQTAAKEAIIPAIAMSALFGLGATGINSYQKKKIKKALNSDNEQARRQAAESVRMQLQEEDTELAMSWNEMAEDKIDKGEPIPLDENFIQYVENKKHEEQSQEYEPPQDLERVSDPEKLITSGKEDTSPEDILSEEDVENISDEQIDQAIGGQQPGTPQQEGTQAGQDVGPETPQQINISGEEAPPAEHLVYKSKKQAQKEANRLTKEGRASEPYQDEEGWKIRPKKGKKQDQEVEGVEPTQESEVAETKEDREVREGYEVLPQDLAKKVQNKIGQAREILKKREEQGLPTDTRAPEWVRRIRSALANEATIVRYARAAKGLAKGDKRYTPERLKEFEQELQEFADTPLPNPPETTRGADGRSAYHPTASSSDKAGRKITNIHTDEDVETRLVWNYDNSEPSYWESVKRTGDDEVTGLGATPEESKAKAQEKARRTEEENKRLDEHNFTEEELQGLRTHEVRTIAQHRNIDNADNKRTNTLIKDIVSQQEGDATVEAEQMRDLLNEPYSREELESKSTKEIQKLYNSAFERKPKDKTKKGYIDTILQEQEIQAHDRKASKNKQPWGMSRPTFLAWAKENHPDEQVREMSGAPLASDPDSMPSRIADKARQDMVSEALARGEEVPQWVLDEMPDSVKNKATTKKQDVTPESVRAALPEHAQKTPVGKLTMKEIRVAADALDTTPEQARDVLLREPGKQEAKQDKGAPDFEGMIKEAARWQGAMRNAERVFKGDKNKQYQIAKQNNKSNLDKYLMQRFGIDKEQARQVSNTLTERAITPDDSADISDFRGQSWADTALEQATQDKAEAESTAKTTESETTEDQKTREVKGPKGEGLSKKEQKEWLLSEIDKAIKARPGTYDGTKIIEFNVPDDGNFKVSEARLEKFKDLVQRKFPTKKRSKDIGGAKVPAFSTAGRFTGAEYLNEFKFRKTSLTQANAKKYMGMIPGSAGYVGWHSNGWLIGGGTMIKLDKKPKWAPDGKKFEQIQKLLNDIAEKETSPITAMYELCHGPDSFGDEGVKPVYAMVEVEGRSEPIFVTAQAFDMVYSQHPEATFEVAFNGTIVAKEGGEIVGVIAEIVQQDSFLNNDYLKERLRELKGQQGEGKKESQETQAQEPVKQEKATEEGNTVRPADWRGNLMKTRQVAQDLGIAWKGKSHNELLAEIDRVDAKETEQAQPPEDTSGHDVPVSYSVTRHAKRDIPLFVISLEKRVERDVFNALRNEAKRLGGWYSSYNKQGAVPGFQFTEEGQAQEFAKLFKNPPQGFSGQTQEGQSEAAKPGYGEDNQVFTKDAAEAARERLRKKLGTLYSGIDPELFKDGVILAGYHIEAGARKFGDFAKVMVDDVGSAIKPYLKSLYNGVRHWPGFENISKDMSTENVVQLADIDKILGQEGQQAEADSPHNQIAQKVKEILESGQNITSQGLFKIADEAYGGTQAQGKYTSKDAYDALEMGINKYLMANPENFSPQVDRVKRAKEIASTLRETIKVVPTQSKRTEEFDEYQQFSTPPHIAYTAAWVANMQSKDTVLEPSAGIGGLALFAKNSNAQTVVNELSERRGRILKDMGFGRIFTENAEQIHNILPDDVTPSIVLMNPPFSATAGRKKGERKTANAQKHIDQALARLEPNGRLVAIVGRGMAMDKPSMKEWWGRVKDKYNVRANVGIAGKEYMKYGTNFDVQIVVIDKDGPTHEPPLTENFDTIEDAIEGLKEVRDGRPRINIRSDKRGEEVPTEQTLPGSDAQAQNTGKQGHSGSSGSSGVGTGRGKGGDTSGISGVSGEPDTRDGQLSTEGGQDAGGETSGTSGGRKGHLSGSPSKGDRSGKAGGASTGKSTQQTNQRPDLQSGTEATGDGRLSKGQKKKKEELSDSIYERYEPSTTLEGAQPHPGNLSESAAMAAVESPEAEYVPNIPKEDIEAGRVSDAQLEPIIYAGEAHKQTLPSGERKGFFIGDGTGVGKGREIAAIIRDNWNRGRKKHVWVSASQDLLKDAKRDVDGIGWDKSVVIKHSKTKTGGEIQNDEGVLFTTYNTLKSEEKQDNGKRRVDQIVEWLGEDFDGVLAFDEAHKMGNAVPMKGKRGTKEPSATATVALELQRRLPKARIVYVSATGATQVSNLAFAERLGLWGPGTPFGTVFNFIKDVASGGVAAMELVASDIKAMGSYVARTLSYDNVSYDRLEHKLTKEQREQYNTFSEAWQVVLQNIHKALEVTGGGGNQKKNAMSAFWGAQQRFYNQVLTSLQVPSLLKDVQKQLEEGNSAVIQLVNTNEADQKRARAQLEEGQELEDLDLTPRQALMGFVEHSFPVHQYEETKDDSGKTIYVLVKDSNGEPVLNKEAVEMREQLLDRLGSIQMVDAPIDMIINNLGKDNVAEVTGRTRRIVWGLNENGDPAKIIEKRGSKAADSDADAFMDGKKRVLIFSQAGGTGFSFHADKTRKNQQKRVHYLLQPGWRADVAVQGLGRSHRSNQAYPPRFRLMTTDVPAQKRFLSTIARRLDQLGALTKGQRQTGSQGFFQARDNLESQHAKDAMRQFLTDLYTGNIEGLRMQEFQEQTGLDLLDQESGGLKKELPEIRQILNRLLSLNLDTMNIVFDEFNTRMDDIVRQAEERGDLDVGMETLRAQSTELVENRTVYEDPKSGAETKYVHLKLEHPNQITDFDSIKKQTVAEGSIPSFVKNVRSGKVWAVTSGPRSTTDASGIVRTYRQLKSPTTVSRENEGKIKDSDYFVPVSNKEAEQLWEEAIKETSKTYTENVYMISGAILPIWDRLEGDTRIIRALTDDGQTVLGRKIPDRHVNTVLNRLGAGEKARPDLTPQQAIDAVLQNANQLVLANDWKIKRSLVSGEQRIEVIGPDISNHQEMDNIGMFRERINFKTRNFIPLDEAARVLEQLTENRPIVDVVKTTGGNVQYQRKGGNRALVSNAKDTNTQEFKTWFGKSVAKAKSGKPIVFFHGTPKKFSVFKDKAGSNSGHIASGLGNFFSIDQGEARRYAGEDGNVMPVYLRMENPYKMSLEEVQGLETIEEARKRREEIKKQGHDSIVIEVPHGGSPIFITFSGNQQKSTDNVGTYSLETDNIYYKALGKQQTGGVKAKDLNDLVRKKLSPYLSEGTNKSINIVQSPHELPWEIYADMQRNEGLDSPAMFWEGNIYIVADNVESLGQGLSLTLTHELTHMGISKIRHGLSARFGGNVAKANKKIDRLLSDVAVRFRNKIQEMEEEGGGYEGVYDELPREQRMRRLAEEILADNPEFMHGTRWYDRYVAAIANFVREVGKALGIETQITDIEIRDMLTQAHKANARSTPKKGARGKVQAKQSASPAFQAQENAGPVFYSQLQSVLDKKLPGKGTAGQYLQTIRSWTKKGQFKQEELEWSGVEEWLGSMGKKEKLTKEQVLDYLRANEIQIKEVSKSLDRYMEDEISEIIAESKFQSQSDFEDFYGSEEWAEMAEPHLDNFWSSMSNIEKAAFEDYADFKEDYGLKYDMSDIFPQSVFEQAYSDFRDIFSTQEEAVEQLDIDTTDRDDTKFSEYQLPGGENYQELLLTLPGMGATNTVVEKDGHFLVVDPSGNPVGPFRNGKPVTYKTRQLAEQAATEKNQGQKGFRSAHWGEPNVLAHVRFNERTDADGNRVLFIEEVQSDWHQAGRKQGYNDQDVSDQDISNPDFIRKRLLRNEMFSQEQLDNMSDSEVLEKANDDSIRYSFFGLDIFSPEPKEGGVPDAPFKTTWPQLAMKRMIRYAAENGFDKVAWTPGEVQADRYDLSKQIDEIRYSKTQTVNGEQYHLSIVKDGRVIESRNLAGNELEGFVGKDVAERIVNGQGEDSPATRETPAGKSLSGLDLKVGGEGMKGFYDKMLPSMLQKYVKKWGAKVGQTEIANITAHSIPVTNQMREAALRGQPMFKRSKTNRPNVSYQRKGGAAAINTSGILSPEVEKRIQDAKGAHGDSLLEKAKQKALEIFEERKSPVEKYLDKTKDAQLIEDLRQHRGHPRFAHQKAYDSIKDFMQPVIQKYGDEGIDVFSMNILLADMVKDFQPQADTGKPLLSAEDGLPFGFQTEEEVHNAYEEYQRLAREHPEIEEAVRKRNEFMRDLKRKLVKAKVLKKSVLDDPAYFHHQVLEYLNAKNGPVGATGSKDVRNHWRGWMSGRKGSSLDYNTEYATAEFEVISQGIEQYETWKTLQKVKKGYNLLPDLRQQAKKENIQNMMDKLEKEGRLERNPLGGWKDPLTPFKQKIAIGFNHLAQMAKDGDLEYSEEWQGVVDSLMQEKARKKDPDSNSFQPPISDPATLNFLNYLLSKDKPGAKWAGTIFKGIKERNQFIKQTLGEDFLEWKDIMKRDYPEHTTWRPKAGTSWYKTFSLADQLIDKMMEQGKGEFSAKDLQEVKAIVPGEQWVIPDRVATQLDHFKTPTDDGPIARTSGRMLSAWKQWVLMNPYRFIKYNLNNLSGDFDIATAYAPELWSKKRFALQAARDLAKWHKGGEMSHELKQELDEVLYRDVIDSGLTVYEIEDLTEAIANDRYLKDLVGARNENVLKKGISRYWNGIKNFTRWRENILRLAAYRFFKEEWARGNYLYGASNPDMIDQLKTVEDKAARLARELIGDYGNVSEAGEYLRRRLIPFWSWQEINAPRYVKLMRNLKDEGRGERAAGMMAWKGTKLALKASALYVMVHMFNHLVHPDEEDDLKEYQRRQMHLILGRREDGEIMSIRFQGALSDALSWFGAEDLPEDIEDLTEGNATVQEKLKEAALAGPTKIVHGLRPEPKVAYESMTGRSLYPDPFSGGRPIRDVTEHILSTFSLDSIYNKAVGKPQKGGGGWAQWFVNDLKNLVTYETDPGEAAYYSTKKMIYDYLDDHGVERPSPNPTNRSNALYYYRQALKYGDIPAAAKYKKKYFELGGTHRGLSRSIQRAHPLAGLPKRMRFQFRQTLRPEEEATLRKAIKWYRQTY